MLTKKQLQLLEFIHARTQIDGVSPSFDEMKEALDLRSKSGIHRLITALEERGFIRRLAHRARAIEIIRMPKSTTFSNRSFEPRVIEGSRPGRPEEAVDLGGSEVKSLPMMGRIAAGVPISAIEDYSRNIAVPSEMVSNTAEHYALEVKGDSMIDAYMWGEINRISPDAQTGDIVVALVDNHEATLKRFRRNGAQSLWKLPIQLMKLAYFAMIR